MDVIGSSGCGGNAMAGKWKCFVLIHIDIPIANIYHQYTPVMLALIYQHHGSVMGYIDILIFSTEIMFAACTCSRVEILPQ